MFLQEMSKHVTSQVEQFRQNAATSLGSFHSEEDGLSTVEMILLLFIGIVIITALLAFFWDDIWVKVKEAVASLFTESDKGNANP